MSHNNLAYYANLLLTHATDLGDERACIDTLRLFRIPEDILNQYLEEIIELARSL